MTAVSNDFNILEYLKPNPDWMKPKQYEPPLALKWLNQNKDSEDDSIHELSSRIFHRHHPVIDSQPPITIRQVRHIIRPNGAWFNQSKDLDEEDTPAIVVNSVRPYARKSRTSSYWQDAGWERRDERNIRRLIGHYKAGGNSYRGSIELKDSIVQPTEYYIYDPPDAVCYGPHGTCFHARGKSNGMKKYWIHFSEEPADIDSGIIQIERNLSESLSM